MSDTYIVQLSHPIMGNFLPGILAAESIQAAQSMLLRLLKEHGVPEETITYDAATHHTITLRGDITLKVYRAMPVEQWTHVIPALIAYKP